jgi:hypothetical protein
VLDTSPQNTAVLFSEQSDDILASVKKKLDSMPQAVIPGATQNQNNKQAPNNQQPPKSNPPAPAKPKK